ncbi:MAG TPA: hypothetical protein VEC17_01760, partial [Candidatus Binatia bacterium]|nr:hypothetical protein [Candidatus Binatia bacterium]
VGNSGNARTGSCATDPGAHLHLVLYKNVVDVNARPITLTSASSGVGPTVFAAPFGYTTQADLAKAANDPTVYVLKDGQRIPVSAASYESHGWNFDKYESVFRPLQNRIFSTSELGRLAQSYYFWPLRDSALLKSSNNPTVYLFEEGRKSALDYQTFTCRGFRFGEILEVRPAERDDYLPIDDVPANGCVSASLQSLRDMAGFAVRYGFVSPDLSSYGYSSDWNHGWNLRWLVFRHTSGMLVTIFHASVQHNTSERYTAYSDPVTGGWSGWQRIY